LVNICKEAKKSNDRHQIAVPGWRMKFATLVSATMTMMMRVEMKRRGGVHAANVLTSRPDVTTNE
jgi:hypothetical protein